MVAGLRLLGLYENVETMQGVNVQIVSSLFDVYDFGGLGCFRVQPVSACAKDDSR